jgi:hypothetical protein
VSDILNNFQWFSTNYVVCKTVFTNKELNEWRRTGCRNTTLPQELFMGHICTYIFLMDIYFLHNLLLQCGPVLFGNS